jgi:hypothetical protein
MAGREIGPKLDDDIATGGKGKREAVGVGHGKAPYEIVTWAAI